MALQPPAETVNDAEYALRTIPVPRLTGRALQAFVTVMENVGGVLVPTLMHQSAPPRHGARSRACRRSPLAVTPSQAA